ncbi:Metallo-dependent phosphatase [Pseudovirgaria hyperparasitica]|uniref:Metallo-dependent phosphatase n=1 Tax=Pseudovirgaria hyperparasitica TaxID=470096 RepID=A0A6A6WGL8_9PEZI|nr:Metallo-dependent phosphatase [Pseudovirgaria hyperparasitica]KAF2761224.1 Metallo-dependent phosphatase [Pseudovirgaria hyperparasitica]
MRAASVCRSSAPDNLLSAWRSLLWRLSERSHHRRGSSSNRGPDTSHNRNKWKPVSIACISDTHGSWHAVPDADILIHAGDLTTRGDLPAMRKSIEWLDSLPHPHKVIIAGNHDSCLDQNSQYYNRAIAHTIRRKFTYLQNTSTVITTSSGRSIRIYGSPFTPATRSLSIPRLSCAFRYKRKRDVWRGIVPQDTDILVTHGPPHGFLDNLRGCKHLTRELYRVSPRLHVFGHYHDGNGMLALDSWSVEKVVRRVLEMDPAPEHKVLSTLKSLFQVMYSFLRMVRGSRAGNSMLLVNAAVGPGSIVPSTSELLQLHLAERQEADVSAKGGDKPLYGSAILVTI